MSRMQRVFTTPSAKGLIKTIMLTLRPSVGGAPVSARSSTDAPRVRPRPVRSPSLFEIIQRRSQLRPPPLEAAITPRQLECLAWAEQGKTAAEIGIILEISPRTVETHIARACAAFGVHKCIHAVSKARQLALLVDAEQEVWPRRIGRHLWPKREGATLSCGSDR